MKTYELTYIIASEVSSIDADATRKDLEDFVQKKGGLILKSEKTTPQVLAYPIKKHTSGYFATLELQVAESAIKEIKEKMEKDAKVLRHFLIIKEVPKKMKERRMKKLSEVHGIETRERLKSSSPLHKDTGGKKKVDLVDMEEKLDEILSE